MPKLTGSVSYLARVALPDAHLKMELIDLDSATIEPSTIVESHVYTHGEQPPIPWELEYSPESIDPRHKYSLRATILIQDEPAWVQRDFPIPVLNGGKTDGIQIILKAAEKAHAEDESQERGVLTGDVVYRERVALHPDARVKVELQDLDPANNAGAVTIAEKSIQTSGAQPPIKFALQFPKASIDPRHKYSLKATIFVNGQPEWVQRDHVQVLDSDKTDGIHLWMIRAVPSPIEEEHHDETIGQDVGTITGDVVYRERVALDPGAKVKVELQDLEPANNAAATTVAETIFKTVGAQVPLKFTLQYPKGSIDSRHKYSLKATIFVNDKPIWVQRDSPFPVLDGGKTDGVHLWMKPAEQGEAQVKSVPSQPTVAPTAQGTTASAAPTLAALGGSFFETLSHAFQSVKESATPAVNQALASLSQAGHIAAEDLGKAAASLQPLLNQAGTIVERDFHLAQEKLQPYLQQAATAAEGAVKKAGELGSSAIASLQNQVVAPPQGPPRGAPMGGDFHHNPSQDAYYKEKTEEAKKLHSKGTDKLTGVAVTKDPSGLAFPSGSNVKVSLSDCSLADAPMLTFSQQEIMGDGTSTQLPFTLTYDKASTVPGHDYRLSVRVEQPDGKLWGITDTAYMVIHRGHQNADGHELQVKVLVK